VRRNDELGAAGATIDKAGQRPLRSPLLVEMRSAALGAPPLHQLPRAIITDAQLGRRLPVPFRLRVLAGDALASGRVLEEALPVVSDLADVELVVEDAVATLGRAKQGRGRSNAAPWVPAHPRG